MTITTQPTAPVHGARLIYEGADLAAAHDLAAENRPSMVRHRDDDWHETWTWRGALRDDPPPNHPSDAPVASDRDWLITGAVCVCCLAWGVWGALALHEWGALGLAVLACALLVVAECRR